MTKLRKRRKRERERQAAAILQHHVAELERAKPKIVPETVELAAVAMRVILITKTKGPNK
jgi:hypothetical protein